MEGLNLISTFAEFKELKNIDRPTMMSVLEDIFRSQLIKMYGSADNFDIIINIDKGDFEIWRNREVVEVVEDPNTQISLAEVSKIDDSYEVGEQYTEEFKLEALAEGVFSIYAKIFRVELWTLKKPTSTTSIRIRPVKLLSAKFTKYGRKRC